MTWIFVKSDYFLLVINILLFKSTVSPWKLNSCLYIGVTSPTHKFFLLFLIFFILFWRSCRWKWITLLTRTNFFFIFLFFLLFRFIHINFSFYHLLQAKKNGISNTPPLGWNFPHHFLGIQAGRINKFMKFLCENTVEKVQSRMKKAFWRIWLTVFIICHNCISYDIYRRSFSFPIYRHCLRRCYNYLTFQSIFIKNNKP